MKDVEMKAGLEIHQQLDSHKLFCSCPSVLRNDEPEFEVRRKLHAIAGETGEVDEAVKHEASLDKDFVYQGYDTTCLVELDEEPPKLVNDEALRIGMEIALLLNCKIIPVTQIMRKIVIDGSNTGGFQRTFLFAHKGYVETSEGRVRIDSVALEEDSARIIERGKKKVIFRLDRLGIPLVEIATAPDIKSPEQAKEVALIIGDILRACKVKRGIGTIRQDVNISTKGHPRVEIKGFQDVKMFIPTIEKEIERQQNNVDLLSDKKRRPPRRPVHPPQESKSELKSEVRRANPDGTTAFMRPMPGSARMYPETDLPLLKISRDMINDVKRNLPKLRGEIKDELKKHGLSDEMIKLVSKSGMLDEFKELFNLKSDANLVAKMLILWPKDFAKKLGKSVDEVMSVLNMDVLTEVLQNFVKGNVEKNDLQDILFSVAQGTSVSDALSVEKIDSNDVEQFIIKLVKEKPGLSVGGYMGLVMKEFSGKVNGKQVMEILKKYVK